MRFLLTLVMLNTLPVFAQTKDNMICQEQIDTLTKLRVFRVMEKMPTVDGGMSVLYRKLHKKMKASRQVIQYGSESKVVVAFIVSAKGEILGKRIIKNIEGTDLAQQLLAVVDDVNWQPGTCNGKPAATLFSIPMIVEFEF